MPVKGKYASPHLLNIFMACANHSMSLIAQFQDTKTEKARYRVYFFKTVKIDRQKIY